MIEIEAVPVGSKTFQYIRVEMKNAPLILLKGSVGYIMCGYLNIDTANKLGDVAVRVTGITDLESMIAATVTEVSGAAASLGLKKGEKVSDILSML